MTTGEGVPSVRPERIPRRRAVTRQRLIAAAHDVFVERGIRDTPIEVICERAGFTRGAFYSNFDSKEDLFLAVFREFNDVRVERLAAAAAQAFPPGRSLGRGGVRTAVREAAGLFAEHLAADRQWYLLTLELRLQGLRQPDLGSRLEQANVEVREGIAAVLNEIMERTGLRLKLPVLEAVSVLIALYDLALENAMFVDASAGAFEERVSGLLPELMASLVIAQPEPAGT